MARAGSAGTKSGSSARSLVLLKTMLAPVVENRTVQGPATALGDEANSIIADGDGGDDLGTLPSQVNSVGDLPTSSVSAVQLVPQTLGSEPTPPAR